MMKISTHCILSTVSNTVCGHVKGPKVPTGTPGWTSDVLYVTIAQTDPLPPPSSNAPPWKYLKLMEIIMIISLLKFQEVVSRLYILDNYCQGKKHRLFAIFSCNTLSLHRFLKLWLCSMVSWILIQQLICLQMDRS